MNQAPGIFDECEKDPGRQLMTLIDSQGDGVQNGVKDGEGMVLEKHS